jgi:predicted amidohydrolase
MIIALASPRIAKTLDEGLDKIERLLSEASARGAEVVCFPEAYIPGLRGQDFEVLPFDRTQQERVLEAAAQLSRKYAVATILGMERLTEAGRQIAAFVIDAQGQVQGCQTKNQLHPSEEQFYVPGDTRRLFEIKGVRFGVVICHEGWRYPETVRWAAVRGAKVVFHPHHTGSDRAGVRLTQWGSTGAPYYEKAMLLRSLENAIYFASVNYALRFQESATCVITPSGQCQAYLWRGRRAGAGHRSRGGDRSVRRSIRTRALSGIHVGMTAAVVSASSGEGQGSHGISFVFVVVEQHALMRRRWQESLAVVGGHLERAHHLLDAGRGELTLEVLADVGSGLTVDRTEAAHILGYGGDRGALPART